MELVAKGAQDEELIDINNKTSIFDYSINKKINMPKEIQYFIQLVKQIGEILLDFILKEKETYYMVFI